MTEIRKDLFPKMGNLFGYREKTIEKWVDEAFSSLSAIFSSKEEFITYLNSISDRTDAELMLSTSHFYLAAKKYEPKSYVKLIMIISIIEKLQNKQKKYQEFYDWIMSQNDRIGQLLSKSSDIDVEKFKALLKELKEDYLCAFGSRRNVLSFFQDYFSHENMVKLVVSMKAKRTETVEHYSWRLPAIRRVVKEEPNPSGISKQNTIFLLRKPECLIATTGRSVMLSMQVAILQWVVCFQKMKISRTAF